MLKQTDWMAFRFDLNEKNLPKFENFNNGFSKMWENTINGNQQEADAWLSSKQNVLQTNEEVVDTLEANYRQGHSDGTKLTCALFLGTAVIVAIPFAVKFGIKIWNNRKENKSKKHIEK